MKRIKWDAEEYLPLIDVYIRTTNDPSLDVIEELGKLSELLNRRADLLGIPHDEKFRNLNGMKLMYQNVVYIATNGATGMSSYSQLMEQTYNLAINDRELFEGQLSKFFVKYAK